MGARFPTPVPLMESATRAMDAADPLAALRAAPDFDLAFLDAMTAHHAAAIDMARLALERSGRPELLDLARAIIAGQQPEIDRMRAWRAAWYPDAPPAALMEAGPAAPARPLDAPGGALLEAADADGWNWRVQIIRAGVSANGNEYPLPVLQEAAPVYAGVPVFYGRGPDHAPTERGFASVAGYITDPRPNADGVEATLEISRGKPDVRDAVRHAWDVQARTGRGTFGFSHVVPRGGALVEARKPRGYRVTRITRAESVDIVMSPAAGGGVLGPLAEAHPFVPDALQEAIVNVAALLAKLREGKKLSLDELAFLQENATGAAAADALSEGATANAAGRPPEMEPAATASPAITEAMQAAIDAATAPLREAAALAEARATLTARLAESRLPDIMRTAIAADFDGRVFEAAELDGRIERDRGIAARLATVRPHGLGAAVEVTADQRTKHQQAMDGLFQMPHQGVSPFRTLKEAFSAITGRRFGYDDPDIARAIIAEASAFAGDDALLAEAITSSTFGEVLGDSIRRRMLQVYNEPDWQTWRLIAGPNIVPLTDFRTNHRMRMGGYGDLPVVPEGAPYQPLTSPTDEEATYAPSKRGGLESITWETIRNDDMGAVRRVPIELAIADRATLYHLVWNTFIRDNAIATYDATALYHANHANLGTSALSAASLLAAENAMRDQKRYGVADRTMGASNRPRFIAIPNELRDTAFRLVSSSTAVGATNNAATEPNIFAGGGYTIIVVDDWTDPNDWYLFADPAQVPTIEVGFLDGREEPELFVQDAATVGSTFTADKVTYKIRHVYGAAIVEHRGTYKNAV